MGYKKFYVYLVYLTDVLGNRYLGIKYESNILSESLGIWKSHFTGSTISLYEDMKNNREKRDGLMYHTTVVNVMEFKKLITNNILTPKILDIIMSKPIEIEFIGIGEVIHEEKNNMAHFIVLESEDLQEIRKILGLSRYDFHITIGFDKKDVFGKSKGEDSIFKKF